VIQEQATTEAAYWDPPSDQQVVVHVSTDDDLTRLLDLVLTLRSGRGIPALEIRRNDGSSVSLGTDGTWALVTWTNPLKETFHSIGDHHGDVMVFDYFGSWSEAPAEWLVLLEKATISLESYVNTGLPDTEDVVFEPD